MIELDRVTKRFRSGVVAVDELSLTVPTGSITVLVGSSGSGKTTVLRMINRLVEPTSGTIRLGGRDVREVPVHELRRGIGYVIQQIGLFPHRSVLENVTTVPRLLGWDRERCRRRALELLELVGIDAALAPRYPRQLSGGQQQRVGVARALAADPPVLLMDEPFGAVDPVVRTQLQLDLVALQRELRKTVVFVTHDVHEALLVGDRIAVLAPGGVLQQDATPASLLADPATEFVAGFLGNERRIALLGLIEAGEVAVDPLASLPAGVDPASLPRVGPRATARNLLDSALGSPGGAVVVLDEAGSPSGVVRFDALTDAIARLHAGSAAAGGGPR